MKYYLAPIHCNECDFKSRSILRLWLHLKKEHNLTFTKRDWKFAIKNFFPFRLLVASVVGVLWLVVFAIWLITYPIWKLHELFEIF